MSEPVILFVCTGNVCRSPMAEYLLKGRLGPHTEWEIKSAGTSAYTGSRSSEMAIKVMEEKGINMSAHRSQPVTRELIDDASLIVVMTAAHSEQLLEHYPKAREKIFRLKSFDAKDPSGDIEDPIGLTREIYRRVRSQIEAAMPGLISFMNSLE